MSTNDPSSNQSDSQPEDNDGSDGSREFKYPWRGPPDQTFKSVGGLNDAKQTLRKTVIDPLRGNRERYERFKIPIPNVLLSGPPGTGKTHLARSAAGEAMVPWVELTGGSLQSKWVNNSTNRVSRLFDEARWIADEHGYALVFLDELDTLLPGRDAGNQHAEDQKVVNEFLRVLERTDEQNTLVIGATNRPEALDHAVTRNGRFDRHLRIDRPNTPARKEILDYHLSQRPSRVPKETLVTVANHTEGWTGAGLEQLVIEAGRVALRNDADAITPSHLEVAYSTLRDN